MTRPLVAYWNCRGRVTAIRLLLEHVGVPYEYQEYSGENYLDWFNKDKAELQGTLDFPNLPYYIDDQVKLTHTIAILEYLGRKHGLEPRTEEEKIRASLAVWQLADIHQYFIDIGKLALPSAVSNPAEVIKTLRKEYLASIPARLKQFAEFLGERKWITGDRLTHADFRTYDIMDYHRIFFNPKFFNEHPTLVAYMERFEALKGVKEYWDRVEKLSGPPSFYDCLLSPLEET